MRKYFLDFRVSKNYISWTVLEDCDTKQKTVRATEKLIPVSSSDISNMFRSIKKYINNLPLNKNVITNVIFNDDVLSNLEIKLVETHYLQECFSADKSVKDNLSLQLSKHFHDSEYTPVTISSYRYLAHQKISVKEYLQFPLNKQFDKLISKNSAFVTTDIESLNNIQKLFEYNFDKVNYFIKTQSLANNYKEFDGFNLLLDTEDSYSSLSLVYNGAVIKYKRLSVGMDKIYEMINQNSKTSKSNTDIQNIIRYLTRNKNFNIVDEGVVSIKEMLEEFASCYIKLIEEFLSCDELKNQKINVLALSGVLANIIETKLNPSTFNLNKVHNLYKDNSESIFLNNDIAILQSNIMTKLDEEDQNKTVNTITNRINNEINPRKSFLNKIWYAITK
ncbi:MAG3720 family protein [Mycoplasmopsis anatis]|uniref:MAG3720 family protein n=1 Tax=Mycoplasmopsis anatis TaxID=171279 RepID=UPI001C4E238F|nr:hypothetical protein [Mycoplasmopsis anatis]MBW0603379.1 hypothetical protein [Mycoplasmopsis anatis]